MSILEKSISVVLLGLKPPYPAELEAEYADMDAGEQLEARREWLRRHYMWTLLAGGLLAVNIVKWAWECGFLAFVGLGSGFATAADFEKLQRSADISAQLQIAAELRIKSEECKAAPSQDQKNRIWTEMEKLQIQYRDIAKERYPGAGC